MTRPSVIFLMTKRGCLITTLLVSSRLRLDFAFVSKQGQRVVLVDYVESRRYIKSDVHRLMPKPDDLRSLKRQLAGR